MAFPPVHPDLARALEARGYAEPTPVQAAVLAPEAEGRDLLVSAQTGSGKTIAFGLALASTLLEADGAPLPRAAEPLALIIAPTRELALQVHRELEWLYAPTGARVVSCVGGMDARREARSLFQGAHIVVGTPGRLVDHLQRGNLDASCLRAVVLDEADEMLDLGFRDDLELLLDAAPSARRTLLFSATLPKGIVELAKTYQRDALRIATTTGRSAHADIDYRAIRVAPGDLEHAIVNVLRYFEAGIAMVFCATRESVRHLHANLAERGFSVVALSGELSQNERSHALQALRDRRAQVCIATDVAARGIDLPELGLVIHAELPTNSETLLHRSGRTGRAGRKGLCAIMVPYPRRRRAERLIADAHIKPEWMAPPSADEVRARDAERLIADPIWTEEAAEDVRAAAQTLLAQRSAEDVAMAYIRLQRARLPEPEELFDPGPAEPAPRERGRRRRDEDGYDAAPRGGHPEGDHAPRERGGGPGVWFRLSIGRNANADPRWLLPLLCRRGHIVKRDIGAIQIFDRETRFEIHPEVAERFAVAASRPDPADKAIRIEPADGPYPGPSRDKPREEARPPRPTLRTVERPERPAAGEGEEPLYDTRTRKKEGFVKPLGKGGPRKAGVGKTDPGKGGPRKGDAPRGGDGPRGRETGREGGREGGASYGKPRAGQRPGAGRGGPAGRGGGFDKPRRPR